MAIEVISTSLDENDDIIRGLGIEVQLDESKFGKRKFNRGHYVEGAWMFKGVELTEERKVFLKQIQILWKEIGME